MDDGWLDFELDGYLEGWWIMCWMDNWVVGRLVDAQLLLPLDVSPPCS